MFPKPNRTTNSRGFTLIELLVAVGIIILLIAISLPYLMRARQAARKSETQALLTSLMTDIENYYQSFNAYPGPAPVTQTTAAANKLSGTQNLLVGLTYGMSTTSSAAPVVSMPGATGPYVDPTKTTGPSDLATNHAYSPFYQPGTKELSAYDPALPSSTATTPVWDAGGIKGCATNAFFAFPTILDRFPDALPILYYRRNVGIDGTATTDGNGVITAQGTPAITSTNPTSATASYYLDENKEYTKATALMSPSGIAFDQTKGSFSVDTGATAQGLIDLADAVSSKTPGSPTGTANARGGYVLISAGVDRIYGRPNTTVGAGAPVWGTSDDIIVVGGQ